MELAGQTPSVARGEQRPVEGWHRDGVDDSARMSGNLRSSGQRCSPRRRSRSTGSRRRRRVGYPNTTRRSLSRAIVDMAGRRIRSVHGDRGLFECEISVVTARPSGQRAGGRHNSRPELSDCQGPRVGAPPRSTWGSRSSLGFRLSAGDLWRSARSGEERDDGSTASGNLEARCGEVGCGAASTVGNGHCRYFGALPHD